VSKDLGARRQRVFDLDGCQAIDNRDIAVERINKCHSAPDDRERRLVAHYDAVASPVQLHSDGGGDLVEAEDDRNWPIGPVQTLA
jgi:hypothetical protein